MERPITGRGSTDLPDDADAGTALARATAASVLEVEWRGRRRLPPDDIDVVVYRGRVDDDPNRYYVILATDPDRPGHAARVFPTEGHGSVTEAVETFQARRDADAGSRLDVGPDVDPDLDLD